MIYSGTNITETIWFEPQYREEDTHCIELIKANDEPIFYVTTCCNDEWVWAFYMDGLSNYEKIKHTIMDTALKCTNMYHLIGELDAIFATDFDDIVAYDKFEDECDGRCCEHCNHRDCLN